LTTESRAPDAPEPARTDRMMTELRERVRARLRDQLLQSGASPAFQDPQLFADVERLLQRATSAADSHVLLLPELLGDPDTWRLAIPMKYESHRGGWAASLMLGLKRRVLMPVLRWLFEYSRDNFERQRRVNDVLFACIQELAIENARLRGEIRERPLPPGVSPAP
jgi:hypothetical protein